MEINSSTLEKGILASIIIVLCFTFFDDDEKIINEEPKILKEYFKEHPLVAWKSNDKGGDVVKIRYKINTSDRRLWIYDSDGELVHKQPFSRDPMPDGTPRDFTYNWRLYKTERTIDVGPGTYTIILGGDVEGGYGQLSTEINI